MVQGCKNVDERTQGDDAMTSAGSIWVCNAGAIEDMSAQVDTCTGAGLRNLSSDVAYSIVFKSRSAPGIQDTAPPIFR